MSRAASWVAARLRAGGDLSLRWAEVTLARAEFGGPSLLTTLAPQGRRFAEPHPGGWACRLDDASERDYTPELVSLEGAKLAPLALSEVDLRRCSFNRAQGLESLRLERVRFAETPSGWSFHWPWRWSRRQTLAEEHRWRQRNGAWGWDGGDHEGEIPTAEQLASLYRALRKGREDIKDEPGAADFYYGEMEMRRQKEASRSAPPTRFSARPTPAVERGLVALYWLVSGYALRSSRALGTLALMIAMFAVLFELVGFEPLDPTPRVGGVSAQGALVYKDARPPDRTQVEVAIDAVTFSAATAASVVGTPPATRRLTRTGELLHVLLRFLGPILVGLALLSFRGRVKR
jgi:hypothetical protein